MAYIVWAIVALLAVGAVFLVVIGFIVRTTITETKGPMPKNHGGFGQTVHGGKS